MNQLACRLRGEFLNGTAWLDVLLTDILSHYFCSEKHRRLLFFTEVAGPTTFRAKTLLLEKILRHEFPDILSQHPKLRERLDALREFRNVLAHNHLDTSAQSLVKLKPDEVVFVKYKLGKTSQVRISASEAQQRADDANELRQQLLALQKRFFRGDKKSESQ